MNSIMIFRDQYLMKIWILPIYKYWNIMEIERDTFSIYLERRAMDGKLCTSTLTVLRAIRKGYSGNSNI